MKRLKIVIPGGSGQVGVMLARYWTRQGHEVVVLSRRPQAAPWSVGAWDGRRPGTWCDTFEGADAIVNLAGRSVNCRYTRRRRAEILDSRVASTRIVGQAIARAKSPPPVWLQMSTATIYAHRYDGANDEATGLLGGDEPHVPDAWRFSIDVARAWEAALAEANVGATRKVLLRSAMVMSPDAGGVFRTLLNLVRFGLGGTIGDGRQFVSWIHEFDFVRAARWLIDHAEMQGAFNLASPGPLPMREFLRTLRQSWGMPLGLPTPAWLLEIGTFLLRTESELVLKSRRVVPGRLLEHGFEFRFDDWRHAADDLCRRLRRPAAQAASGVDPAGVASAGSPVDGDAFAPENLPMTRRQPTVKSSHNE